MKRPETDWKVPPASLNVLIKQSHQFIAYSALTGIIAQPGISSTDKRGELGEWRVL